MQRANGPRSRRQPDVIKGGGGPHLTPQTPLQRKVEASSTTIRVMLTTH